MMLKTIHKSQILDLPEFEITRVATNLQYITKNLLIYVKYD
jgi:hypothetical protein